MRVAVLIPSEEYRSNAGARIRYGRIGAELAREGISLELCDIAAFDPADPQWDAILISKCHDARALVLAATFADEGRLVGVDLFDDYFSQEDDSRLLRFRTWLAQLVCHCHFALCSTEAMKVVVERYRPDLPVHVMNDPADGLDEPDLAELLAAKLRRAKDERKLRLVWFGIGDNPHYEVGLSDLAAFGERLLPLRCRGFDVNLTVLTNPRALTASGLAKVNRLPVATTLMEWSTEAEEQQLREALCVFLPVNGQAFSRAKSLNRAVSALTYGCQVLSVGHPLYSAFEPLIYRDAAALAADVAGSALKFSPERLDTYRVLMEQHASASREARALGDFLRRCSAERRPRLPLALVHGHTTHPGAHQLVKALGGLSVASPFCTARLDADMLFRQSPGGLTAFVNKSAVALLRRQVDLQPAPEIKGAFLRIGKEGNPGPEMAIGDNGGLPAQLVAYDEAMRHLVEQIDRNFGPHRVIISEISLLPFSQTRLPG